ncbi:MAG: hypothetical protein AAB513_00540 [Patescibacteria group bacterium]
MQLLVNLQGDNGHMWLDALKKFNRKENPWNGSLVDLDVSPFVPEGWAVEEHKKGGHFRWDASKVMLSRKDPGSDLEIDEIREGLRKETFFNANLLDYLLKNPHLIPDKWKEKYVLFWGTIYRDLPLEAFCIRCLCWNDGGWGESHFELGGGNFSIGFALIASS